MPGDRQHRLAVQLGVVQPVEQVDAAGAGGRQADAQPPGELGVAAGHERGGLLVPHLDEADLVLVRAQRLHDAVDAVAGQAEDSVDSPVDEALYEDVGGCSGHGLLISLSVRARVCSSRSRWDLARCARVIGRASLRWELPQRDANAHLLLAA